MDAREAPSSAERAVWTSTNLPIVEALRREVDRWEGTPHVLGGTDASGMDCSAFVQRVFADAFDVPLPRTTEEQVRSGRRVNRSELSAGDLVFFQPPTKTNHVGIYLSDGEFAHVSSSEGVMISELDLDYWRTAYWTSRRVLDERADPVPVIATTPPPAPVTTPSPRPSGRRIGW